MAQQEFEVVEYFRTAHFYTVMAESRADALDKVLNGDHEALGIDCVRGDVVPTRPIALRDVRRVRRGKKT